MRLLIVAEGYPPDAETGRAAAFARIVDGLARRHAIRLVCGYRRDRALVPTDALAVDLRGLSPLVAQGALWRAARAAARKTRPDVILSSGAYLLPGGAPAVLVVRDLVGTGWEHRSAAMGRLLGWGLRRYAQVVVPTLATWRELRRAGAPEWRVARVPDPFEPADVAPPPEGSALVLVHPGRILPAKGQHLSIDAVSRLSPAEKAHVELHVVGPVADARYHDQLRIAARDQPVSFHVDGEPIADWIRRAHLVLYPTCLPEGFADAAVEALAAGRPIVFADHLGVRESVGGIGLPVPPDDVDAVRAAIRRALDDRPALELLGRRGRAFVRDHYGWDVVGPRWEEALHAALKRR